MVGSQHQIKKLFYAYLAIAAALFILLSSVQLFQHMQMQSQHKVLSAFSLESIASSVFALKLLYYYGLFFLLHIGFALVFLGLFKQFLKASPFVQQHATLLGILWLLLGLEASFLLNQILFPRTIFNLSFSANYLPWVIGYLAVLFTLIILALCLWLKTASKKTIVFAGLCFSVGILLQNNFFLTQTIANTKHQAGQPNIIVIGIDSLRTSAVKQTTMPFVSNYINDSAVFNNAITPLGRTYGAWMSVLTGRYPINHGARFNLVEEKNLTADNLYLPELMREQGYQTLYATDERRFSNIDEQYGYETVVGPDMGAIDFVLAFYSDYPLINLASRLLPNQLIELVLPGLINNRGLSITYQPEQFAHSINQALDKLSPSKPIFLNAHYCLAHWPYFWSEELNSHEKEDKNLFVYESALKQVDRQIKALFSGLKKSNLLDNAIVLMFSDHGENLPGETTVFNLGKSSEYSVSTFGHGSSVLLKNQIEVLMAWKRYGSQPFVNRANEQIVSLVDVAPTILDLLTHKMPSAFDGESLSAQLYGKSIADSSRNVYTETGFYLPEMESANPNIADISASGAKFYRVNKAGNVRIKQSYLKVLLAGKQRAILNDNWLVAELPVESGKKQCLALNRFTNELLQEEQVMALPALVELRKKLKDFYQGEL